MKGDYCVAGWVIKGKYAKITSQMYAVFEFIVHYLVHMIALVFLYGKVIRVSKRMLRKQEDTTSANTQKVIWGPLAILLLCYFSNNYRPHQKEVIRDVMFSFCPPSGEVPPPSPDRRVRHPSSSNGEGTTIQSQWRGTPIQSWWGGTHLVLTMEYPIQSWWGHPHPVPMGVGVPQPGQYGVPPIRIGWGTPRHDWMGVPSPQETEQQSDYLLHSGRYPSCFNAGGLSCSQ